MENKTTEMKLFFFSPNDYGAEYGVMSDSKESALEALKRHLLQSTSHKQLYKIYKEVYDMWESATVDNLPEGYSIIVYEKDSVIETENG